MISVLQAEPQEVDVVREESGSEDEDEEEGEDAGASATISGQVGGDSVAPLLRADWTLGPPLSIFMLNSLFNFMPTHVGLC